VALWLFLCEEWTAWLLAGMALAFLMGCIARDDVVRLQLACATWELLKGPSRLAHLGIKRLHETLLLLRSENGREASASLHPSCGKRGHG